MKPSEFAAIMVAAAMIVTPLILTNQPVSKQNANALVANPRFALQFASGEHADYWDPPTGSGMVVSPDASISNSPGQSNIIGSFFGGMWRYMTGLFQF